MDLTSCPECGRPAEVRRRFVLASTDGPIEHADVRCIDRHWFALPIAALDPGPRRPSDAANPAAAERQRSRGARP